MAKLLKGLAMAAGASVALGVTSSLRKRPLAEGAVLNLEPLFDRLDRQETEMSGLRVALERTEHRIQLCEERLRALTEAVPVAIDARVEEFRAQVDPSASQRVDALEQALAQQSTAIGALQKHAEESDAHFERLISAIEKLCERAQALEPTSSDRAAVPFQAELDRALAKEERKSGFPLAPRW